MYDRYRGRNLEPVTTDFFPWKYYSLLPDPAVRKVPSGLRRHTLPDSEQAHDTEGKPRELDNGSVRG